MITSLMADPVTVVRYGDGPPDRLGRATSVEVGRSIVRGRLEQSSLERESSSENGEFVAGHWLAYLPLDVLVGPHDRLLHAGRAFAVDGAPNRRTHPGVPALDHWIVRLKLVEG